MRCRKEEELPLDQIRSGTVVRVVRMTMDEHTLLYRRLFELGLFPGTELLVERRAPLGDPMMLALRGSRLTLRKKNARDIFVEKIR